jgi:hypothetical protein
MTQTLYAHIKKKKKKNNLYQKTYHLLILNRLGAGTDYSSSQLKPVILSSRFEIF